MPRTVFETYHFALVVCRHPKTKKYLGVEEINNRGWWLPGGGVDQGETFREGAIRECLEEANVKVELKGILSVEQELFPVMEDYSQQEQQTNSKSLKGRKRTSSESGAPIQPCRQRVVFYAEPSDISNDSSSDEQQPKKPPGDAESIQSQWLTLGELEEMSKRKMMRGNELLRWGREIEKAEQNGKIHEVIFPMTLLDERKVIQDNVVVRKRINSQRSVDVVSQPGHNSIKVMSSSDHDAIDIEHIKSQSCKQSTIWYDLKKSGITSCLIWRVADANSDQMRQYIERFKNNIVI